MGCVGEMVLLRLMAGWVGRKARWSWQGPREKTGGWEEETGAGSLFLPGWLTGSGCQATPMQTAPLRVPVQMTVRQRWAWAAGWGDPLEWANGAK